MTTQQIELVFIIGGAVLIVLEFVLPGMISVFLGASAVIIGILFHAGYICNIHAAVLFWFVLSLILVLTFRNMALKLFPSESKYQLVEDDVDAIGAVVEVLQTIDEKSTDGRISYNGTSWPAISNKGVIQKGEKARLIYRDNISWVVEPCE